jgi:type III pantothenate kinase
MRWVTFDQGNSSLKWCLWEAAVGAPAAVILRGRVGEGSLEDELVELRDQLVAAPVEAALFCGVTDEVGEASVRARWETISGGMPWREPAAEIESDCEDPEAVGSDRRFAALAAFDLKGEALVVDAGTALTVDAVGSGPTFLGGAIAPGPRVLADALERAGAQLIAIEASPGERALGRSTAEALRAGVCVGFEGAAARLVEEVSQEAALEDAPVILTGGARSFLKGSALFKDRPVHVFADLVHLGMLVSVGVEAKLQEEPWPSSFGS